MLILMINMFIAVGSFGIIIPILPAYQLSIGQGGTAAGLMIAIFAGAQLVMSPIAGKWTDRYGRRIMIILGLSGLALSMFVFYFSDSIGVLYLSRVIGGVGAALLIPAIFAYVVDITTMDQRAKGNIFISASMSLALAALGFLLSIFVPSYIMFFGVTMIIFLSTSILRPVLTTLISKLAGSEQGFAMGMNNAYMSIGNVLGPLLAGLLFDVHILYPFILGLIVLVITIFVSMKWKGPRNISM